MTTGSSPPSTVPRSEVASDFGWLAREYRFRTLIDIGANDGAYGAHLAARLAIPRVIAFEPLPVLAEPLRARGFEVHAVALGARDEEVLFHAHDNAAVSSLLPVSALCLEEFPNAARSRPIRVMQRRLDSLLATAALERPLLIKMDAQGVEDAIIDGGRSVFAHADVVITEASYVPLYERQAMFADVHVRLTTLGLRLAGIKDQYVSPKSGRPLFAHVIYERAPGATVAKVVPRG